MRARLADALPDVFLKAAGAAHVAALGNADSRLASKFKSHDDVIAALPGQATNAETLLQDIGSIDKQMDDNISGVALNGPVPPRLGSRHGTASLSIAIGSRTLGTTWATQR